LIIVREALQARADANNPVRIGLIGAGFMARGIVLQVLQTIPGLEIVAVANRSIPNALRAFNEAGAGSVVQVSSEKELEASIAAGQHAITDDPMLVCRADSIDVVLEVTGTIDYAAACVLEAISHNKHIVLMNAELDCTIGPILKVKAHQVGLVYTNVDGDQPGVIMNLHRFVTGIGVNPVLCGSIKGLQDPYRTPETQATFAKRWNQNPHMVTSFADGTKISFEQGVVANATGMRVARRGMLGINVKSGTPIDEAVSEYSLDDLLPEPGIVDYVVGATPGPGVFVLGTHENPRQQHYLDLYKLGKGPLYCFHTPYHLCHFEAPYTAARAVLFGDATITPLGPPRVEVITTAKRDLKAGETLDGIGGYMSYGQADNARACRRDSLLPMGLAEGSVIKRDIPKDTVLTFSDVSLPENRLRDVLWKEQCRHFHQELG
jgi:predicted homoserine dehydrogenase-like protein